MLVPSAEVVLTGAAPLDFDEEDGNFVSHNALDAGYTPVDMATARRHAVLHAMGQVRN